MRGATVFGMIAICGLLMCAAEEKARLLTFAKEDAGRVPEGWKAGKTGKGDGSIWKVVADETGPSKKGYVLAQTASGPNALFNLCVAEETSFKDGVISVSMKAVKGEKDQGGGIMWRFQDSDNYYIARFNPLEGNYRLYKVVAGKRIQLATEEDLKPGKGEWITLTVTMKGNKITCGMNGKILLEATDDTFAKAGKVGLWTKSDAQTAFDSLKISGD